MPDPGLATCGRQQEVRQKLLAVENAIAAELDRLEAEIGAPVIRIDLVRYDSGYKASVRIGAPAGAREQH